jgi:uncharacterized membrane protein YfcA
MHASEIFTTGSSSLVYMRYKNINMKLFKALLWPGIIGTIIGATVVSFVSKDNISIIKPIVALYTLTLGVLIILRALKINLRNNNKIKQIFPVAFFGGFLDALRALSPFFDALRTDLKAPIPPYCFLVGSFVGFFFLIDTTIPNKNI